MKLKVPRVVELEIVAFWVMRLCNHVRDFQSKKGKTYLQLVFNVMLKYRPQSTWHWV